MFSVDSVKERLIALGYEVKEGDDSSLAFCFNKVSNSIKNDLNRSVIPNELEQVAIDRVVGEFLFFKKTFSPADLTGFDLDYAVKQIQTGDTNVVFTTGDGSTTPEQRLTMFINYLLVYGKDEFSSFRCIRW